MGIYINPKGQSKEEWLLSIDDKSVGLVRNPRPDEVLLCHVSNPGFTALAVCYNRAEFYAFNHPDDHRFKIWVIVPKSAVCPEFCDESEIEEFSIV